VFENRVLRRIFGSKREDVAGGWRRLHNEELHDLYALPNVWVDEVCGTCTTHWRDEKGRTTQGSRRRREDVTVGNRVGWVWAGFLWLRTETSEHGNERRVL
jgi:hypothetical protein